MQGGPGAFPELSRQDLARAQGEYFQDVHAPSQRHVVEAKLRTVKRALALWDLEPYPPTVEKVHAVGTVLKAGRYRSAESYLSIYKTECERQGFAWGPLELRANRDAVRSCTRGIGAPKKALPLPFDRLASLPGGTEPWVPSGPIAPRNLVVLGSWFLLREAEVAAATVKDLKITVKNGRPRAEWYLPASKTDQRAEGVARTHGCCCGSVPRTDCPAHAAWDHASALKARFGDRGPEAPLFPNLKGEVCHKETIAKTLEAAADHLGVPKSSSTGRISGHTMRVTGAQGLAASGLDLWAIQLLGRWGSAAVKGYVQDAHLKRAERWAAESKQDKDLEELVKVVAEKVEKDLTGKDLWESLLAKAAAALDQAAGSRQGTGAVPAAAAEALATEAAAACSGDRRDRDVVYSSAGIAHAVLFGPTDVDLDAMSSVCGWRFGKAKGARMAKNLDPKTEYKYLCARCFATERERAKAALSAQVVALDASA